MCSIYSFGVMTLTYLAKDVNMLVVCGPGMIFTGFMTIWFFYAQGLCFGLATMTYISIWVVLKFKTDQVSLLKPISIILGFLVGGWIFNVILGIVILQFLSLTTEEHLLMRLYGGITVNIGIASDFFVFWFFR